MGNRPLSAALLAMIAFACSGGEDFESTPADVSGTYTVSVTNREDSCGFPNWEQGKTSSDIKLTLVQDGENISATIDGVVGGIVEWALGTKSFQGSVDGDHVHATGYGTNAFTQANCTYTINLTFDGTLSGDSLQGTLTYAPKTNGSPDCGVLEQCQALQDFAGSRPPK
jgi:hypothetical protein